MNWDNKDKDPWGGNNDAPDFDELMKKFSSILGGKKSLATVLVAVVKEVDLMLPHQEYLCMLYLPLP